MEEKYLTLLYFYGCLNSQMLVVFHVFDLVAKLVSANVSGPGGCGFESCTVHGAVMRTADQQTAWCL